MTYQENNLNNCIAVKKSTISGQISLSGAKNSALRMLAISLLTKEDVVLTNCPTDLIDMRIHCDMLRILNKSLSIKDNILTISENRPLICELNWHGQSIRNTLIILGALLTRFGYAKVPLPGGCKLGCRPYDLHEIILRRMGASIWNDDNFIYAESNGKLHGAEINLPISSNGATENAIIAGCLADGITLVRNPHITPEILDIISLLNKMGANIYTYNGNIIVHGVKELRGAIHNVINDNVEAITFIIATAITGGELNILNFPVNSLKSTLYKLQKIGIKLQYNGSCLSVLGGKKYNSFDICAGTYPSIYSDMQPLFAALALFSHGTSSICDLRWPNRFQYLKEFVKLGGKANLYNGKLQIEGGNKLIGTKLYANDIRSGASVLLAGLGANGTTIIFNARQLARGYQDFVNKFRSVNCNIEFK